MSDNISSMSASFVQKEKSEHNSNDVRTSSDGLHAKEEHTLSDAEYKEVERNLFNEPSEVLAGRKVILFPNRGHAWHPNFDQNSEI